MKPSTRTLRNQEIDINIRKACDSLSDLIAKGLKPGLALWRVSDVYGISVESIKRAYREKILDEMFWGSASKNE